MNETLSYSHPLSPECSTGAGTEESDDIFEAPCPPADTTEMFYHRLLQYMDFFDHYDKSTPNVN